MYIEDPCNYMFGMQHGCDAAAAETAVSASNTTCVVPTNVVGLSDTRRKQLSADARMAALEAGIAPETWEKRLLAAPDRQLEELSILFAPPVDLPAGPEEGKGGGGTPEPKAADIVTVVVQFAVEDAEELMRAAVAFCRADGVPEADLKSAVTNPVDAISWLLLSRGDPPGTSWLEDRIWQGTPQLL